MSEMVQLCCVTPHVGVWIETVLSDRDAGHTSSHTSCRCVDWNVHNQMYTISEEVTPHVGVWIETLDSVEYIELDKSHLM